MFRDAAAIGCDCVQIFVRNQRQWHAGSLRAEQVASFQIGRRETGITPVVAHAGYLLNLAAPDADKRAQSVAGLINELERCEALGVEYLVLHPGAHLDDTLQRGMRRVAKSLDKVHRTCAGFRCRILLETTAGQGSAIGWQFGQLAGIMERTKEPGRLGVCLDTCHLFAAGYDFRKTEDYAAMIDELDRLIGTANVKCIHMNDSKREAGSRVDRHEHIGKGKIGKKGLAHLVKDKRFHGVPMILETPKGKDGRGTDLDRVNLKRLRAMIET